MSRNAPEAIIIVRGELVVVPNTIFESGEGCDRFGKWGLILLGEAMVIDQRVILISWW